MQQTARPVHRRQVFAEAASNLARAPAPAFPETHFTSPWNRLDDGVHGALRSARSRKNSDATSSIDFPCRSAAALRAAIMALSSSAESFSKIGLISGCRSKVV